MGKRSGDYFRKIRLSKDNHIIFEYIEKSPDFLTFDEQNKIINKGEYLHDSFERNFYFKNGYSAKIEYWISPTERDQNYGMYTAEYRKMILKDEIGNILSQVFEKNPNYIDPKFMVDDEGMDDSMLF